MSEESLDEADISTAVLVFAHYLGIDLESEQELLPIAENALRNLPTGWALGIGDGDNAGIPYFFNEDSGASVWKHPKEAVYIKKVKEEKKRIQLEQEEKKRNRKTDDQGSNRNHVNQNDRGRDSADRNSGSHSTAKSKDSKSNTSRGKNDVVEVSEFFHDDDDDDSVGKFKKPSSASTGAKKNEAVGQSYGMSAADFLSDDEVDDVVKTVFQPKNVRKETEKKTATKTSWNEATADKDKAAKTDRSRSESISWDDDMDNEPVPISTRDGTARGKDDANKGKDIQKSSAIDKGDTRSKSPGKDAKDRAAARQAQEKESRKRENSERESRDREAREKDLREKEKRDRERDNERERAAEKSSTAANSSLVAEAAAAKAANRDLEDRIADLRHRHVQELDVMRASNSRLEERLTTEKEGRRDTEERLTKFLSEGDARVRETEDAADSRLRENQKKTKAEADEDLREKTKALERRYNLEIEEAKIESISNKKKLEECLEQLETVKRKAGLSKEDGKLEGKAEADAAKAMVKDLEEQLRTQGAEYRKHRDDHGAMASRLASALQTAQVAMAECEAAKAQAAGAMSEGQTSHSALIQATHRIQHLDSECAQMKADLLLSRSIGETQDGDTRKLQTICSINEEKLALTTSDLKRLKATTQSEINRQNSRVAELDALNSVLRTQMDLALNAENSSNRDLQRLLDKAEYEESRLRDRLVDVEAKAQAEAVRCVSLEKESRTFEELMRLRERNLRDEKQRADDAEGRIDEVRMTYEAEISSLKVVIQEEKAVRAEMARRHKAELEDLKKDIAEKVPKIVSTAVERVESQLALRVEKEVSSAKMRYENQTERVKQELLEMQGGQAEREARHRVTHAEEKAELDRLRYHSQRLQRRVDELEEELEDRKSMRRRRAFISPGRENGRERERERQRDREKERGGLGNGRYRSDSPRGSKRRSIHMDSGPDVNADEEGHDEDEESSVMEDSRDVDYNGRHSTSNAGNRSKKVVGKKSSNQHGGQKDKDEDSLAIQTMSLIHGQLTAMKHQLLTISNISQVPEVDLDVSHSHIPGSGSSSSRPSPVRIKLFQNNTSTYQAPNISSSSSSGRILDPGVLHASEQAIQRMFRPHQQQQQQQFEQERKIGTYPGPSGSQMGGRDKYVTGQLDTRSIFPTESLLLTPQEKKMHMASTIYQSTPGYSPYSYLDPDLTSFSSRNGNNSNSAVATSVSLIRDRDDLRVQSGVRAEDILFDDPPEGGFQEGYWRYCTVRVKGMLCLYGDYV